MKQTTETTLRRTARAYIEALRHTVNELAQTDPDLTPLVASLDAIDHQGPVRGPFNQPAHHGLRHLETLAKSLEHPGTQLADAINAAIMHLDWSPVYGGAETDRALADGLFTAQAAGNYGGFHSDGVSAGLFLLAPDLHYPFHTHEAAEIYYCIAGEIEVQHGLEGEPQYLKPGEYSFTPPHQLHALTTRDQPALLAYSWHGDLHCETWWWAEQHDGSYARTAWRRLPGQSWQPHKTETVSDQSFAQAHRHMPQHR